MANFIEDWIYKGATEPRSYYKGLPLGEALKAENPFSKYYEGFDPKYKGAGKASFPRYLYEGAKSLFGGQHGNIAGGTTGMRALYERAAPWIGKAAKGIRWAGSAPAAGIMTALHPSAGAGEQELQWERENMANINRRETDSRPSPTNVGNPFGYQASTRPQAPPGQPVSGRHHGYQAGGSVNPHEETTRAARDWSPREQYISRSNQDRMHDATINRIIQESQGDQRRWEQGGGQGAYPVFNEPGTGANSPVSPGWLQASSDRNNSGVMLALANSPAVNKMKNIYNQVDPFFPEVDIDDQRIGYDFNKNLWGGNLGFGGEYDMDDDEYNAYINWGTNW